MYNKKFVTQFYCLVHFYSLPYCQCSNEVCLNARCFLFFVREIFLGVFKWVKLPSGCVVPGSCSPCNFWLLFCKILLGGCLSVPFWLGGSLGKEHHAKLVQDLSNWQVWAASPIATFVAFGVQGAVLASAFLCPVCSISWLGSSWEVGPTLQVSLTKLIW